MTTHSLTDEQLNMLFDEIPVLAGAPRRVEELSGGLTNRNLKVSTPDGVFVVRCSDTNAEALEIDRDIEFRNSVAAEEAGVGAPVLAYRPDLGILVIGFIEGSTLSRSDFGKPGVIERAAQSCRRLHEGPRFVNDFNMFERQQGYWETVRRNGFKIPPRYLEQAPKIEKIRVALSATPGPTVPCNNDLLAENFVDDGDKLWLIDYEYSGNNDPCFELGNLWCECRLDLDQLELLVTSYFGRPSAAKLARARLQGIVGQYGWTLWGAIQHAVSPLAFDFWEWSQERMDIALSHLNGPDLDRLIGDVLVSD
ncbi:phosphotransferase family protein [Aeromicrobium panaciterrae]|uniref:phosphotransferase n=1 Tax=Aeromicrobium panaciterrae TaxID=363861 RepID=UPI0031DBA6B7